MSRSTAILAIIGALVLGAVLGAAALQVTGGYGMVTYVPAAGEEVARAVGPHHYGWGFGVFPLFGILFPILFIFLIFALFRAAFGGSRWGNGGPPWADRRTMAEEWHRQMHSSESGERRPDSGTSRPSA